MSFLPLVQKMRAGRILSRRAFPALAALACLAALQPGEAQAQTCPYGMQPVQQLVPRSVGGPHGGTQWVPIVTCIPIPYSPPGSPHQNAETRTWTHVDDHYTGIAVFATPSGKRDYALSLWGTNVRKNAEEQTLKECDKKGGTDCRVDAMCVNQWVAVARGEDGGIYFGCDKSKGRVRKQVRNICRDAGTPCAIEFLDQRTVVHRQRNFPP